MIKKRNQKVMEMNERGIEVEVIAKKFKLSGSRIRQILSNEPNYCLRHSKYFKTVCPYCEVEETYKGFYSNSKEDELVSLAKDLSKLGKSKGEVLKKRIYVRLLKDNFKYSFSKIGRLLKKHHSTIMSLYYN